MASLKFEKIYSRFFSKIQAYDFLELSEDQLTAFLSDWLRSAFSKPYVRRLFNSFVADEEIQEFTYEIKYSVDEYADEDFIVEIFSLGMIMEWLEPKINNILNISQMFGSKEEKFYSQSNHLNELRLLRDNVYKKQRRMIADRGYAWNSYLDGE